MRFYSLPDLNFLFRDVYFSGKKNKNCLFLTFDDCSDLILTEIVLNLLEKEAIKASFFCIGKYLFENRDLAKKIYENHVLGNHTFNHFNCLKVSEIQYVSDVLAFQKRYKSIFFRPPYGKLTFSCLKKILRLGLKVIYWNLMPYDFDLTLSFEKLKKILASRTKSGTIVVFHINEKTKDFLPGLISWYVNFVKNKGLKFCTVEELIKK